MKPYTSKKTNVSTIKAYYMTQYRQALFSERLNEVDCKYLELYFEQNDYVVSELVLQLMEGYFKNRSIFPYEVSRQLHKIKYQYQKKRQEERKNQIKLYNLEQIQNQLFVKSQIQQSMQNKVMQYREIVSISSQIDDDEVQEEQIYQFSKESPQYIQKKNEDMILTQIKCQQIDIIGMSLSLRDQQYIQIYLNDKKNLSATQITEQLLEDYFKSANIFTSVIEEYVNNLLQIHQANNQQCNICQIDKENPEENLFKQHEFSKSQQELVLNSKQSEQSEKSIISSEYEDYSYLEESSLFQDDNTILNIKNTKQFKVNIREALDNIYGETFNITSAQLFSKVNLLPKSETEALWKFVSGKYKHQYSGLQLQDYFQNQFNHTEIFRRNKFSVEDQNVIFAYVQNTTSTSATSIAKKLLKGRFNDRDIPEYLLTNKIRNELVDKKTKRSKNVK
ncbi:Hypothetical_protein [Hexamita inflata]|uniref:Hypothetical_protein n=1 Tax=Hexamita inflata TaxID=28002 RepID=A0AA86PE12_9EUKA|nr:Hypothetical protein HINF_LOCUS24447 [Hexamita inflata]